MSPRGRVAKRASKKRPVRPKAPPAHGHDHSHGHTHGHGQDHDSGHGHAHALTAASLSAEELAKAATAAQAHREPLPPGAGEGGVLFLDTPSGIAGDMTIAALVDMGVPFDVVTKAVAALSLPGVALHVERAHAGAIGATRFHVFSDPHQPERTHRSIDEMLRKSRLDPETKALARAIFEKLGRAEAEVHRIPLDEVHFHEVGAVDAIVDVVGSAACFAYLGADVVCSPLPMGRGFTNSRHGILPLPAPATVACLRGIPTYDAGVEKELVTPTGAAIVATVARRFERWPAFSPTHIGWGAGTRVLADRPNAVRAVLGEASDGSESAGAGVDTHAVIEATVDDMTGEVVGHAIAALMSSGALDAWVTPATMKKGRPGLVISALARAPEASRLAEVILRETTSIGVRVTRASRVERPRTMRTVSTRYGDIPVKVSGGPYGEALEKPEFDVCAAAAAEAGVQVRVVIAEVMRVLGSVRAL